VCLLLLLLLLLLLVLLWLLPSEHIQKQIERGYAEKDAQLTFWPTNLGESLISSYRCVPTVSACAVALVAYGQAVKLARPCTGKVQKSASLASQIRPAIKGQVLSHSWKHSASASLLASDAVAAGLYLAAQLTVLPANLGESLTSMYMCAAD
jgi:hypothetical protein